LKGGLTNGAIGDPNRGWEGEEARIMLPADEDYARALMALFAAAGTRPGESLPAGRIGHDFVERNFGRAGSCGRARLGQDRPRSPSAHAGRFRRVLRRSQNFS
jgi:hypothetical protein